MASGISQKKRTENSMCGFVAYVGSDCDLSKLKECASKIKHRGPDNSSHELMSASAAFAFHRLAIIDLSESGNQPLKHPQDSTISLVCNGEIYNYLSLKETHGFKTKSNSDCEVILHLYKKFGIERTVKLLDGVFSFALYDSKKDILFCARDQYGVRPSFIGWDGKGGVAIASEMKSLIGLCDNSLIPFPPSTWWSSDIPYAFISYNHVIGIQSIKSSEEDICKNIKTLLTRSVSKRMMSDREVGCLLSGGLDSSLVSSLVASMSDDPKKLKTFSIGMEGSPDLAYAKLVADHIGSDHHSIQLTEKDFLDVIEEVIYSIESYDTTTVRASIGNYLVSKYIRENTDVKVVFNGDGADEACMGYVYNANAPSASEFHAENYRLLEEIHLFDVLRSDRCISSNGLEARTPFLDPEFVTYYLSIPPEMKMFGSNGKPEKYLLRKAFENSGLLPSEVLHRSKCAFSDGVSSIENSWHQTLKKFIDSQVSDEEFEIGKKEIVHCKPVLKESYYYRKIFNKFFKGNSHLIPHFWMPLWCVADDPSARELDSYRE